MNSIEFFNKVINRKIRWSTWDEGTYIIPRYLIDSGAFNGLTDDGTIEVRYIANGFEKSSDGNYWILLEELPKTHMPEWF